MNFIVSLFFACAVFVSLVAYARYLFDHDSPMGIEKLLYLGFFFSLNFALFSSLVRLAVLMFERYEEKNGKIFP
jgi:hypothetical protein